ncbi:unnamed protein product [Penicillium nalgiovense]|nr:unnamed protein product [Penicillium nalgiovense]CAG8085771.1 unnamed protein product [Penicillium nalgiovense]CAG8089522.1 unnamed protein product [Penicillium nalgiovense]CAG8099198.1 unnamed protein product [Penicillium nalgiovense]CAG8103059.1 unnamed protein product [Penicillium nalgiovense]
MDSSTSNHKRSAESLAEAEAKRQCTRAPFSLSIHDAFETIHLCGDNLYENFRRLSDSNQRLYFENVFETLRSFPRIDLMVLQQYDKGGRLNQDELEATHLLQKKMEKKWCSVKLDPKVLSRRRQREFVKWDDDKLWWNPCTRDFELRDAQSFNECHSSEHFETSLRHCGFLYHISSSLLLYRLTLLMGDSESISTDGYKSCWEVRFYHTDGFTFLRLWDSKGGPRASFYGSKQSQNDALEFVNLLTTYKFPHTYDGTIAGAVA